jgi:hypothetical protein
MARHIMGCKCEDYVVPIAPSRCCGEENQTFRFCWVSNCNYYVVQHIASTLNRLSYPDIWKLPLITVRLQFFSHLLYCMYCNCYRISFLKIVGFLLQIILFLDKALKYQDFPPIIYKQIFLRYRHSDTCHSFVYIIRRRVYIWFRKQKLTRSLSTRIHQITRFSPATYSKRVSSERETVIIRHSAKQDTNLY